MIELMVLGLMLSFPKPESSEASSIEAESCRSAAPIDWGICTGG